MLEKLYNFTHFLPLLIKHYKVDHVKVPAFKLDNSMMTNMSASTKRKSLATGKLILCSYGCSEDSR